MLSYNNYGGETKMAVKRSAVWGKIVVKVYILCCGCINEYCANTTAVNCYTGCSLSSNYERTSALKSWYGDGEILASLVSLSGGEPRWIGGVGGRRARLMSCFSRWQMTTCRRFPWLAITSQQSFHLDFSASRPPVKSANEAFSFCRQHMIVSLWRRTRIATYFQAGFASAVESVSASHTGWPNT